MVHVRDVHLRFERFSPEAPIPFSFGCLMKSLDIEHTTNEGLLQSTSFALGQTGVYCRTHDMAAGSVLPPDQQLYQREPQFTLPKDRKPKDRKQARCVPESAAEAEAAAEAERVAEEQTELERRFFRRQYAVLANMEALAARAHAEWSAEDWFIGPLQVDRGKANMLVRQDFKVTVVAAAWPPRILPSPSPRPPSPSPRPPLALPSPSLALPSPSLALFLALPLPPHPLSLAPPTLPSQYDPDKFDYEGPISVARASLGHVGVQASELQLAALLSLQSFKADYHLWATYALRASPVKAEHPSVAGGEAARAHWRLAKDAVMAVLNKGKIHAGNITLMLQHAREYKRSYYLMLLGVYGAKDFNPRREKAAVREHRSRLRTTDAACTRICSAQRTSCPPVHSRGAV